MMNEAAAAGFGRSSKVKSATETLRIAMRDYGEVLAPDKAEEPILAPTTRRSVFEWLAELRAVDELKAAGLEPRSTALLSGPPGCGKTTLAHHLAARLGIPMVTIGSEGVFASLLGESEKRLTTIFDIFGQLEFPFLVFLDEVEAIGGSRSRNRGGGADNARGSILTVLLRKIETFKGLLVAATNRPEDLDVALWRRFNLQVKVDLPEGDERFAILRRYGAPYGFADEDLDQLVEFTRGASPALLRGLMEGIKRSLVLAPRLRREISDPIPLIEAIVASVRPPPEIVPPLLWQQNGAQALGPFTAWPPALGEG